MLLFFSFYYFVGLGKGNGLARNFGLRGPNCVIHKSI